MSAIMTKRIERLEAHRPVYPLQRFSADELKAARTELLDGRDELSPLLREVVAAVKGDAR